MVPTGLLLIESILLVSRQGKTRLAKWYLNASLKEKTRMIRDITSLVLSRPQKQCNFIEFKEKKIIYKRYASLYFIACISKDENELITLEAIHLFVEVLDRYFGNVWAGISLKEKRMTKSDRLIFCLGIPNNCLYIRLLKPNRPERFYRQAYYILDELFIGGYQLESSKKEVLRICTQQEDYMDESKEEGFVRPRTGTR
ncbi:hypothetical protein PsorP6_008621 [Peronosclerospora sorghi]|uniref:Uncharacterized protein n=1 Tax=Peronosclerospora sorghi TaxID=230839 RepID=A0ACC0WA36_9STRA|nr:hypothetical protein PsorP6_008621 [Peronosclerospora sorghi]